MGADREERMHGAAKQESNQQCTLRKHCSNRISTAMHYWCSEQGANVCAMMRSKLHRTIVSAFFWAVTLAYLGLFLAALILQQWQLQNLQDNPLLGPSKDTLIQLG